MQQQISLGDPVPPRQLFVIFGSDKQIYFFDTNWNRAAVYLQYLRKRWPERGFYVIEERNPQKIQDLW